MSVPSITMHVHLGVYSLKQHTEHKNLKLLGAQKIWREGNIDKKYSFNS